MPTRSIRLSQATPLIAFIVEHASGVRYESIYSEVRERSTFSSALSNRLTRKIRISSYRLKLRFSGLVRLAITNGQNRRRSFVT